MAAKELDREERSIRSNLVDAVLANTGKNVRIVESEREMPVTLIRQDNYSLEGLPAGMDFEILRTAAAQAHRKEGYFYLPRASVSGKDYASMHFRKGDEALRFIQMQYVPTGNRVLIAAGKIDIPKKKSS